MQEKKKGNTFCGFLLFAGIFYALRIS